MGDGGAFSFFLYSEYSSWHIGLQASDGCALARPLSAYPPTSLQVWRDASDVPPSMQVQPYSGGGFTHREGGRQAGEVEGQLLPEESVPLDLGPGGNTFDWPVRDSRYHFLTNTMTVTMVMTGAH